MSEFKGTPGKWEMRHSRISWWIESPKDMSRFISGPIPADVWHQEEEQRNNCEALANGRLIAASKDLLEALIAAENLFHHTFAAEGTIHKQIRAAIAKALQP